MLDVLHQTTIAEDHTQTIVFLPVLLREILTIEDTQHLPETVTVLAAIIPEEDTITIEAIHRVINNNNKATVADALETRALTAVSESEICHCFYVRHVNEKRQDVT